MIFCTVAARRQIAHARVLAESVRSHHPGHRLAVLVLDDVTSQVGDEPFDVLRPADLGFPGDRWHRLALIHDAPALARAIQPWVLRHLRREYDAVVHLDVDVDVLAPLDNLATLAREHAVVLTPRRLQPVPDDGCWPSEREVLDAGVFDLGVLAVAAGSEDFLAWWASRMLGATDALALGDPRFADQVPTLFPCHVLRDPGVAGAYWNLDERPVEEPDPADVAPRATAGGAPLRCLHLAGFDLALPHLLCADSPELPRILLSEHPEVAHRVDDYAARLAAAGAKAAAASPYGFAALSDGTPVDERMRRVYRTALRDTADSGAALPPDPFHPARTEQFLAWLAEPDPGRPWPSVSRYLHALYSERPDVQAAFPDLTGPDADGYLVWVLTDGRAQTTIPERLLPSEPAAAVADAPPHVQPALEPGVNVAGYFRAEFGVAQAARLLLSALDEAQVPHSTQTYAATVSRQAHPFNERGGGGASYDTNIVCVNADLIGHFARDVGEEFFRGRYTVGMWAWEVEEFPEWVHAGFNLVDEIWVGSDYSREAVQRATEKPVFTFPLPVVAPDVPDGLTREALGLPDGFVFLFCFDFFSVAERKNPVGLVEAFAAAFEPGAGPTLVIKTVNGDHRVREREQLLHAVRGRPDIRLIDGYLSAGETAALMALADCYVSLHRAEGFGLTLAESMALGKPVIGTAYSGNLGYMTEDNSYLVPYTLVPVGPGREPYPAEARWAEPDLVAAARLMRHVVDHPDDARRRGERARADLLALHGPQSRAAFVAARLDAIHRQRAAATEPAVIIPAPPPARRRGRRSKDVVRRAAARLMGPYAVPQASVDEALSAAIDDTEARARRREEELARGLQRLTHELQQSEARARAYAAQIALLPDARALGGRDAQLDLHEAGLARLGGEVADLADEVGEVRYMTDTRLLLTTDESGREALGYRDHGRPGTTPTAYASVERVFRGTEADIRDRLRVYVELLAGTGPVLDVGCGRGELLALLAAAGIPARGIDIDAVAVAHSAKRAVVVEQAEAVAHLEGLPAASVGAVVSTHLVEHLTDTQLHGLIEAAFAALRPGGLFVAETINPHSLAALKTFYADLSRQKPVFPETALVLCRQYGFDEAWVLFPHGSGKLDEDRRTEGEYAVVARKGWSA